MERDHVDITGVSMPAVSAPPTGGPSTSDLAVAMHEVLDHVVGHVPGVVGAIVSSADGFALASRLPPAATADAASVAAMSAALVGLSNRLLTTVAPDPAKALELRSEGAHGYVFAVGTAATLTLLTVPEAERPQIMSVGREVTGGLLHLLRAPDHD
jgi:predicted regulator of Ras-like GTPase activity (Roadblock/LC7/MglB family)